MQHWDNNIQCQCPNCKVPYYRKLNLQVNHFISELAGQFRQSAKWSSSANPTARAGQVVCDICTDTKMKALKSCLVCLASYCETHLQPHLTATRLKRHQLIDPVENLDCRMCTIHDKPLELYCKTDQSCVCMLCPVLDHKQHEVIPLKEQFEKQKQELWKAEAKIQRLIEERCLKTEDLIYIEKLDKEAAESEKADVVRSFKSLKKALEEAQAELIGEIEEKQRTIEKQAKEFIVELEQETSELIMRRAEMENLSRSGDHLRFLQTLESLRVCPQTKDWAEVTIQTESYDACVRKAMEHLEETLSKEMKKIFNAAKFKKVRESWVDVTFDPSTAHRALAVSDDRKQVHHGAAKNVPDQPQRFSPSCCVLGEQGFSSGRFYFEVGVERKTRWTLGVAKESIKRKGVIPLCPDNGHWTIWLKNEDEYAALGSTPLPLTLEPKPNKVGVFVDYEEGLVAFYDGDSAALLYSFTDCSFTENIHPFVSPGLHNDGENSAPMIICQQKCPSMQMI